MHVKDLSTTPFETILDCFLKAFEGYFVPMPTAPSFYRNRWKASKVDFRYSFGMFDGNRLVSFVIHAIGKREGELMAFNTGTGVISEYRGKHIVSSLYDHAFKELAKKGIQECTLEVITKNQKAIGVYERIGFEITKTYKCFKGRVAMPSNLAIELQESQLNEVDWPRLPNQQYYAWDHHSESVLRGHYRYLEIMHKGKPESFFVINTDFTALAQFDVFENSDQVWERLFFAIGSMASRELRINNVEFSLKDKLKWLNHFGFVNTVDQFEMRLRV